MWWISYRGEGKADVELGDDGRVYMSCQDTNTVVALLPKTSQPVRPARETLSLDAILYYDVTLLEILTP